MKEYLKSVCVCLLIAVMALTGIPTDVLGSVLQARAETQQQANSDNKRIAYFSFDEGIEGEGATATFEGGAATTKDGYKNKALYLNGSQFMTIKNSDGKNPLTGLENATISYYSLSEKATGWSFFTYPKGYERPSWPNEHYLAMIDNPGNVELQRWKNSGDRKPTIVKNGLSQSWRHVVVVFGNEENVDTTVYIDGVKQGELNSHVSLVDLLGEESTFQIGKANWDNGEFFKGYLDEFSIYNYAMTGDEVSQLYTDGLPKHEEEVVEDPQMLAHYSFGDIAKNNTDKLHSNRIDSGAVVKNTAEYAKDKNYDAVIRGKGATLRTDSLVLPGGAAASDSNEGPAYVELPGEMFKNEATGKTTDTLSVNIWFQNLSDPGDWTGMYVGTKAEMNQSRRPLNYWLLNPYKNNAFKSNLTNNTTKTSEPWQKEQGVTGGNAQKNWQMYTTVISSTTITTYLDGKIINRSNHNMKLSDWTADGTAAIPEIVSYIGRGEYLDDKMWNGAVKECSIYNYELSQDEISDLYRDVIPEVSSDALVKAVSVDTDFIQDNTANIVYGDSFTLPTKTEVQMSDGSRNVAYVTWKDQNGKEITSTKKLEEGTYQLKGEIKNYFPEPFIEERADPQVYFDEASSTYYFTSSYPAYGTIDSGYDKVVIRKSKTLMGLRNAEEHTIWSAPGSIYPGKYHIWAPELHHIGSKWYCYFAGTVDGGAWSIRPRVLVCDDSKDITKAENWTEHIKFADKDGGDGAGLNAMSLDMTYFENHGKHYVIYASITPESRLLMGEVNPEDPTQLLGEPIELAYPEYDWERIKHNVDEGPSVLKKNGKIYVVFSASGTGDEYCMGMLTADENADLMNIGSWKKSPYPVLQTKDLHQQYGPGHNSFTVDEDGNAILVYHARDEECHNNACGYSNGDSLYDPCRNALLAYVRYAADGTPVFSSTAYKELKGLDTSNLTYTINVAANNKPKIDDVFEHLTVNGLEDVRGNIYLPTKSDEYKNVKISWKSSDADVVHEDGVVVRPKADTDVKLTATISVSGDSYKKTKEFTAHVKKTTKIGKMTDYLFAYFIGESAEGEQMYFADSRNGLDWKPLNDGSPVIRSTMGEKGLRDPFIMRSHEGDKFYLIATDLRIANGAGWGAAQTSGSKSIMVWESTDLVNWSNQRMCKIAPDNAGCTWAPEAFWDEESQDYVVFWASKTSDDNYNVQHVYKCHTRDFYTYSEPEVWITLKNAAGNDISVIDTTVLKVGDTYYRLNKNESGEDAVMTDGSTVKTKVVYMEKASSLDGEWTYVPSSYLLDEANQWREGTTSFKFNDDDVDIDTWCVLLDNFGGGGYYPAITNDVASGEFTRLNRDEYSFPTTGILRHGSVLNITTEEYERLEKKWGDLYEKKPETSPKDSLIANLTFDDEEKGYTGAGAKAEVKGSVSLSDNVRDGVDGKSAYLAKGNWMNVTKEDGSPLLTGLDEFTLSYYSKADASNNTGWTAFISKNANPPADNNEYYIGALDKSGSLDVERYYKNRSNDTSTKCNVSGLASQWRHVVIVCDKTSLKVYVDGDLRATSQKDTLKSVKELLGDESVFQIGKANWGGGEYYQGYIDDVKVYNRAFSTNEIGNVFYNKVIPVQQLTLKAENDVKELKVGEKLQLITKVLPETATDTEFVWTSSDEKIATVNKKGEVEGIAKGKVTITATAKNNANCSDTYELTVTKKDAEVKPETKPESKPEVKPETKPESKPEVKPEVKPEPKPEVKPEIKPESKPEVKPVQTKKDEPVVEAKTEDKKEDKKDDKPVKKDVVEIITQASEENRSEPVIVTMNGETKVTKEVLETLKDKDVAVELVMDDNVTWIINGKDVTGEDLQDIDLGVTIGGTDIPEDTVKSVAKDKKHIDIRLAHNGEFGFKASLKIKVGKENANQFANLFYFNPETGKLEFMSAAKVDKDGFTTLEFNHASDYSIIIDKKSMETPVTIYVFVVVAVVVLFAIFVLSIKKKKREA